MVDCLDAAIVRVSGFGYLPTYVSIKDVEEVGRDSLAAFSLDEGSNGRCLDVLELTD